MLLRRANFPFGEEVEFSFPGGLAPKEAPVASLPRSSRAVEGEKSLSLPHRPSGVRVSWSGSRFDAWGNVLEEGETATCLSYYAPGTPPDRLKLRL